MAVLTLRPQPRNSSYADLVIQFKEIIMPVQISYLVSDRNEVERISGLHVEISFKRSEKKEFRSLEATVELTEELEPGEVAVREDELHLPKADCEQLVRQVCREGHGAASSADAAAAGIYFRDFDFWLSENVTPPDRGLAAGPQL